MNFNKMDPAEVQFFTTLVEKYSTTYRSMLPKKGHAKYSDFQSRSSSAHADVPGDWGARRPGDVGFAPTGAERRPVPNKLHRLCLDTDIACEVCISGPRCTACAKEQTISTVISCNKNCLPTLGTSYHSSARS